MTTRTPPPHLSSDRVAAVAAQLHAITCTPGTSQNHRWTGEHLARDRRLAVQMMDEWARDGWHLCPLDYLVRAAS